MLLNLKNHFVRLDYGNVVKCERLREITFHRRHVTGVTTVTLTSLRIERGMTWHDAFDK